MQQQVLSYQIADNIDVKGLKNAFKAELYYSDSTELFYKITNDTFIYIFKYGVVCFLNCDSVKISEFLQLITQYSKNPFTEKLTEEYVINTNASENKIGYNQIEIIDSNIDVLRLIMLNVSQSVALDYYDEQTTK